MLSVHVPRGTSLERINIAISTDGDAGPRRLARPLQPDPQEDKLVERALGIAVPTREEMQEIEVTSRLYVENGARYMTATLMCHSDTDVPRTTAVTFILSGHRLITVRYDEPKPFAIVGAKLARQCPPTVTGETVMMDLLDAVIDRAADILERSAARSTPSPTTSWNPKAARPQPQLQGNSQIHRPHGRPHLQGARKPGLDRPAAALSRHRGRHHEMGQGPARHPQRHAARRAIPVRPRDLSVAARSTSCSMPCSGVVSLEQNNIIKIFSVAAVVFMPPTLIASIYGMNFKHMPELEYEYGYPMAIVLMLLAAVVPYFFFKWMKWL